MKKCKICDEIKELVYGSRLCRECRNEIGKQKWREKYLKDAKICPICKSEHIKVALECSIKCMILNRHEKINDCWIWKCKILNSGYGELVHGSEGKRFFLSAHRESYKIFKGEIKEGLCVCHTCDNRKCVNPEHLWVGTHKDNIQDAKKKNRLPDQRGRKNIKNQGENHHMAKLTEKDVLKIRESLSLGSSQDDLAIDFRVSKATIQAIYYKRNWKYLI